MPRIGGGGGGPIVPPQTGGAGQTQQTQQTQQPQKTDFASKVAQQAATQGTDAARAQVAKSQQSELSGKVKDIAKKFANGAMTQKEATKEFVSLVIEERFPQFKKKKKKKKQGEKDQDEPETAEERLEEAVTELIDRDPGLAKKLSTQFKKLAKG
jgi:hypothetical protein